MSAADLDTALGRMVWKLQLFKETKKHYFDDKGGFYQVLLQVHCNKTTLYTNYCDVLLSLLSTKYPGEIRNRFKLGSNC